MAFMWMGGKGSVMVVVVEEDRESLALPVIEMYEYPDGVK